MFTIYLDLDGTLLDIAERYWRLHTHLTARLGGPQVERSAYWRMKRQGARIADIWPGCPQELHKAYDQAWLELIEDPLYLRFDTLHKGVAHALEELGQKYRLVLATMRRNPGPLKEQLSDLGLVSAFQAVLCDAGPQTPHQGKEGLLRQDPQFDSTASIVVGDTEAEVQAGKRLGIPSVVVLNGLRAREWLKPLGPTYIIPSVSHLPSLLRQALTPGGTGSKVR